MSLHDSIRQLTGSLPLLDTNNDRSRYLLRLSDTHCYVYFLLNQLLSELNVVGIIHTGGLSASINMTIHKHLLLTYEEHLSHLSTLCQQHHIDHLWIRPKEQDHLPSIKRILPQSVLITDDSILELNDRSFKFLENDFNTCPTGNYSRQNVELWRFRQLIHGVKCRSQIELINLDTDTITSYSLPF